MDVFTDSRDGCQYKIVKIGNLLWFAENLRYKGVEYHFPNKDSDNVEKYGYLYTFKNAMKACPSGWRLPTMDEFYKLISTTEAGNNSSSIRDVSWENGSNQSGFSALPAGLRYSSYRFYDFGSRAYFWSSTSYNSYYAGRLNVYPRFTFVDYNDVQDAFSVRYVKELEWMNI